MPALAKIRRNQSRTFAIMALSPAIIFLLIASLTLTVAAINLACQNRTLLSPRFHYIEFNNFVRLFSDQRFLNALRVSGYWELLTLIGTFIVAIPVAIFIYERIPVRRQNLVCLALTFPLLLPRVSVGLIWRFFYAPTIGLVNFPLYALGLPPVDLLGSTWLALSAVAIADIWQWGLFFAVIILKLFQTVPTAPIESALIDGAKVRQKHLFVILPMLRAPLLTMAFVKAIESLRSFDLIYTMTNGGPGIATETLDLYAYQVGINLSGRISYATSMSLLLLILTILIFTVLWRTTRHLAR
jgi:multiple sugar transport system permease protein